MGRFFETVYFWEGRKWNEGNWRGRNGGERKKRKGGGQGRDTMEGDITLTSIHCRPCGVKTEKCWKIDQNHGIDQVYKFLGLLNPPFPRYGPNSVRGNEPVFILPCQIYPWSVYSLSSPIWVAKRQKMPKNSDIYQTFKFGDCCMHPFPMTKFGMRE